MAMMFCFSPLAAVQMWHDRWARRFVRSRDACLKVPRSSHHWPPSIRPCALQSVRKLQHLFIFLFRCFWWLNPTRNAGLLPSKSWTFFTILSTIVVVIHPAAPDVHEYLHQPSQFVEILSGSPNPHPVISMRFPAFSSHFHHDLLLQLRFFGLTPRGGTPTPVEVRVAGDRSRSISPRPSSAFEHRAIRAASPTRRPSSAQQLHGEAVGDGEADGSQGVHMRSQPLGRYKQHEQTISWFSWGDHGIYWVLLDHIGSERIIVQYTCVFERSYAMIWDSLEMGLSRNNSMMHDKDW